MIKHTLKKEKDFVQIPNSILINPDISLKAKGVIVMMLSLPDNWSFSIEGIAGKCKESRACIASAIRELETSGYIKRKMMRGDDGRIIRMEYEIFEEPYNVTDSEGLKEENSCEDKLCTVNPSMDKPSAENPPMDNPLEENRLVNNTISNKKENNNIIYNNINPILSNLKCQTQTIDTTRERKVYKRAIKENIDFDTLVHDNPNVDIEGIVEIMLDAICSKRQYLDINRDEVTQDVVKSRFLNLTAEHISYVIDSMQKNTTKIGNIRSYLLTSLYNSYVTHDHYYRAEVNHDLYG